MNLLRAESFILWKIGKATDCSDVLVSLHNSEKKDLIKIFWIVVILKFSPMHWKTLLLLLLQTKVVRELCRLVHLVVEPLSPEQPWSTGRLISHPKWANNDRKITAIILVQNNPSIQKTNIYLIISPIPPSPRARLPPAPPPREVPSLYTFRPSLWTK